MGGLISGLNSAKKLLSKRVLDKTKVEIKKSVWRENSVSHRLSDEIVELSVQQMEIGPNLYDLPTDPNTSATHYKKDASFSCYRLVSYGQQVTTLIRQHQRMTGKFKCWRLNT